MQAYNPAFLDRLVRLYDEALQHADGDERLAIRTLSKRIDRLALGGNPAEPLAARMQRAIAQAKGGEA